MKSYSGKAGESRGFSKKPLSFLSSNKEILEVFEKLMRLEGLSKTTIKTYKMHIEEYFRTFSTDIIKKDVAEYLNQIKIKVDNRKFSRSHYNQIQYAFNKYWEIFYGCKMPILNRIKVPTKSPEIINKEDIVLALTKIPKRRDRIIFSLGYFSMLRHAEIWRLDLFDDIDTRNKKVYIRAGKGWKNRVVILSEYTKRLVEAERQERIVMRNPNTHVCAVDGSPDRYICYKEVGRIIKNAGKRIGIEHWHPHLLRHSGSSHLDDNNTSTRKIQRLLGHSKITTTQRYLHPTQDQVLDVRNPLEDKLLLTDEKTSING